MSEERPANNYQVGFGRPPVQHRFEKGKSGNPKGRPRKTVTVARRPDPATEPAVDMLQAEAYRTVTIREGDLQIELPVIQAVYRSLGVAAIKGNRHAAKSFAELVGAMETDKRDKKLEYFQAMCEYRDSWLKTFALCDAEGRPRPDPTPHPDDIELFPLTGDVIVRGPWTEEQRDAMLEICIRRDETIRATEPMRKLAARGKASPDMLRIIAEKDAEIARWDSVLPERMRHTKDWVTERLRERREQRMAEHLPKGARPNLYVVPNGSEGGDNAPPKTGKSGT